MFSIPGWLVESMNGAILEMTNPDNWEAFGTATPDDCVNAAIEMMASMSDRIGVVEMTVGNVPEYGLLLDGSTVLKADYPDLWDVLPGGLKDGSNIYLPDFTDRFPMGGVGVGGVGGEAQHTLTLDEIPAHDHGEHTHLPGQASGELPTQVPDFPIPDPFASRGGGLPHNNLPPFVVVKFYVIAK